MPGYDYAFETYMYRPAGAGEDYVDAVTTEDPLLGVSADAGQGASIPVATIVGVIVAVMCVALIVVLAVVYKRRKAEATASTTPQEHEPRQRGSSLVVPAPVPQGAAEPDAKAMLQIV